MSPPDRGGPRFRAGGYILDFWGVGYRVAERMSLEAQLRDAGYRVRKVRSVGRDGRTRAIHGTDVFRRSTQGKCISLPRSDLAAIYSTVETQVETIFGNTIVRINQHERRLQLTFERGPDRAFDLLIGADGLHSAVRRLAFEPEEVFGKDLGYQVAAFELEGYRPCDELEYVLYNIPGGQVGWFSLRGDRTLFLFVFRTGNHRAVPRDLAACKTLLHDVFVDAGWECSRALAAMQDVDEVYFDAVSQIRTGQWSKGRIMLIGDAAACVLLLAGEGAGLAMTEAYVLAGELKRANGDRHDDAFRNHKARLRAFIEGRQRSAETFASFFAPKTRLGIWARNLAMRAMSLRALGDLLVGSNLWDEFELPEYDL